MSSDDLWEGIRLTWKIENFSFLKNVSLPSPSFGLNSPEWEVDIYIGDDIGISVHNWMSPSSFNNVNVICSFALLDCDGIPLIWKDKKLLSTRVSIHFHGFIPLNRLYSNKTKFLPNDTLTLQYSMWRTPHGLTTPVSRFAHTRIEPIIKVIKKTFSWDVVGVSSILPPQSYICIGTITDGESLTMKLTLNKENEFHVELTTSFKKIHVQVIIVVLDASGKKIEFANCGNQFHGRDQKWSFFTNITKSMLLCYPNQFLPSDTLSLQFTCICSGNVIFNRMVVEREILVNIPRTAATDREISEAPMSADEPEGNQSTTKRPPKTINQALKDMFDEGFLSDFNLRVGERMFPVHRPVLGMRSQVFRAMFTTEMKEKEDNFVDIPDVDEDTLQRMLEFVYSDKIDEDMRWENASSLYAAADKYALEPLKQGCSAILQSGLCVSSVLEVLSLADMHQDQDLKSAALDFISLNDQDIVDTECWIKFEEENAKLALDTLRNLYRKKMNV